jgi:GT2 family glycosyltransferase
MMRRELLEEIGGFDESLPACEDYDLWLRVSLRHPIHLIEDALVVKRGGHDDQLSRQHSLDRYRIQSLLKILGGEPLTDGQTRAARTMLREKCRIYAAGCRKHGRIEEAKAYEMVAEQHRA